MKRAITIALLFLSSGVSAFAQTEGRISVGASVTFVQPTDSEVGSLVGYGPLVRLNPRKGWGFAGGLSWFRADIDNPSGSGDPFVKLRVRPIMGGVAYTVGEQPVLVSFSIVAAIVQRSRFRRRLPQHAARRSTTRARREEQRRGAARHWHYVDHRAASSHRRVWRLHDQPAGPRLPRRRRTGIPQPLESGLRPAERRRGLLALLRRVA